jgi:hypothetical protein
MSEDQPKDRRARNPDRSTAQIDVGSVVIFVCVGTILYFIAAWPNIPEGSARWITTSVVFGAFGLTAFSAVIWNAFGQRLGGLFDNQAAAIGRWVKLGGDFLVFLSIVALVIAAAVWLNTDNQIFLLKLFSILYFSLLPPMLYLQFTSRRQATVWREYVLNLFRLHIDDYAHLPRPPTLSRFHEPWQRARDKAWRRAHGKTKGEHMSHEDNRNLEKANIYRRKFQDLFGPLPEEEPRYLVSLRSPHKLQVAFTTTLIAIGWTFVVRPETVFDRSITPSDFQLAGLPTIPRETFAFAFLGAYFYILQMLVRRYFQNDLKATAYLSATMRIIIVMLLVWTIDPLLHETTGQPTRSALAFVIGVFPTVGWQALTQLLVRRPFRVIVPTLHSEYPLSKLDGLNIWYEARLLEEGVEDMQNLATADLVDVMLNTRIPVERLVDWVDQSLLYLHVPKGPGDTERDRLALRRYGIRTATDLMDAFAAADGTPSDRRFCKELERLLNVREDGSDDGQPSVIRSIRATLARERNLQHVISWKSFRAGAFDVGPGRERPSNGRVRGSAGRESQEAMSAA